MPRTSLRPLLPLLRFPAGPLPFLVYAGVQGQYSALALGAALSVLVAVFLSGSTLCTPEEVALMGWFEAVGWRPFACDVLPRLSTEPRFEPPWFCPRFRVGPVRYAPAWVALYCAVFQAIVDAEVDTLLAAASRRGASDRFFGPVWQAETYIVLRGLGRLRLAAWCLRNREAVAVLDLGGPDAAKALYDAR